MSQRHSPGGRESRLTDMPLGDDKRNLWLSICEASSGRCISREPLVSTIPARLGGDRMAGVERVGIGRAEDHAAKAAEITIVARGCVRGCSRLSLT